MTRNLFYKETEQFTFDDVLLVPQYSEIRRRSHISLKHGLLNLDIPVISANMSDITGPSMVIAMNNCGGLGILHRFMDVTTLRRAIAAINSNVKEHLALSVGVNSDDAFIDICLEHANIICIDIAHGHSRHVMELSSKIKKLKPAVTLIAGNIVTGQGVKDLVNSGVDICKIGVGPGAKCCTREVTGHGYPQLSAILDCREAADSMEQNVELIADGGLTHYGDVAKAIGAGADYVMSGKFFAGTDEAPGAMTTVKGVKHKQYKGEASLEAQMANGRPKDTIVPEGVASMVPCKGPVSEVMRLIAGGLRSALSYSGASTIKEFHNKVKFIKVSNNTVIENNVRP